MIHFYAHAKSPQRRFSICCLYGVKFSNSSRVRLNASGKSWSQMYSSILVGLNAMLSEVTHRRTPGCCTVRRDGSAAQPATSSKRHARFFASRTSSRRPPPEAALPLLPASSESCPNWLSLDAVGLCWEPDPSAGSSATGRNDHAATPPMCSRTASLATSRGVLPAWAGQRDARQRVRCNHHEVGGEEMTQSPAVL